MVLDQVQDRDQTCHCRLAECIRMWCTVHSRIIGHRYQKDERRLKNEIALSHRAWSPICLFAYVPICLFDPWAMIYRMKDSEKDTESSAR